MSVKRDRQLPPRGQRGQDDTTAASGSPRNVNDAVAASRNEGPQSGRHERAATIPRSLAIRLYVSHFLSTWNSRLFEAAVVYFLASIFPDNLLPISIYALVRNAAAIALTVPVGRWIDTANRLTIVRSSILAQRISVAASCCLFWFMLQWPGLSTRQVYGLFSATVILACIEKLSAGVNLVSVERDWIVILTEGNEDARRTTNARMRRIDLFCKLVGPLAIAFIAAASVAVAIYITIGLNLASVLIEYLCIAKVFHMVPNLLRSSEQSQASQVDRAQQEQSLLQAPSSTTYARFQRTMSHVLMIPSLKLYFGHSAAIPSFALSLLYWTVLSFSGQMLTYLLASNINLWQVGLIRGVSTIFELSATWIAPRLMKHIGVVRTGMWSITWQMMWLAGGVAWYFSFTQLGQSSAAVMPAAGLAGAVALSRVGLWGFDLSAQNIIQDEVQDDRRGMFSIVETAFQNIFDLLSWALTLIWSNPASFRWPVIISVAAVYAAGGLYTYYVRQRRGHLIHAPSCLRPDVDSDRSGYNQTLGPTTYMSR